MCTDRQASFRKRKARHHLIQSSSYDGYRLVERNDLTWHQGISVFNLCGIGYSWQTFPHVNPVSRTELSVWDTKPPRGSWSLQLIISDFSRFLKISLFRDEVLSLVVSSQGFWQGQLVRVMGPRFKGSKSSSKRRAYVEEVRTLTCSHCSIWLRKRSLSAFSRSCIEGEGP